FLTQCLKQIKSINTIYKLNREILVRPDFLKSFHFLMKKQAKHIFVTGRKKIGAVEPEGI
ncbi:TPA: hypothetical protein ACIASD_003263, partial [Salmonella enterica subsp. enterica serovar Give]